MRKKLAIFTFSILCSLVFSTKTFANKVPVDEFLEKLTAYIEYRQSRIETSKILNGMGLNESQKLGRGDSRTHCYINFGNVNDFIVLAKKGITGVVVDPNYLSVTENGDSQAVYQNVNNYSLAISSMEEKYNGHIILSSWSGDVGATELHEAIHAAAYAFHASRTDLDKDGEGYGAPEYISKELFNQQFKLLRFEKAALQKVSPLVKEILQIAVSDAENEDQEAYQNAEINRLMREIYFVASQYLGHVERLYKQEYEKNVLNFGWRYVTQLSALWGGRADWKGLLRDARNNVKVLEYMGISAKKTVRNHLSQPRCKVRAINL